MKTFKMFLFASLLTSFSLVSFAQEKTEAFKVSGECGMCQTKIEKAAKTAGASFASWDTETKELKITFDSKSTDRSKIQQAIAKVGYDTPDYKATKEAYDKLHGCCKYERESASTNAAKDKHACCDDQKCDGTKCHKDGKCEKDMSCCKDNGCAEKDCCKKA
jgi:periplasmic mercuric ion binding protein